MIIPYEGHWILRLKVKGILGGQRGHEKAG